MFYQQISTEAAYTTTDNEREAADELMTCTDCGYVTNDLGEYYAHRGSWHTDF